MDEYTQLELQDFIKRLKTNKNAFLFLEPIESVIKECPDYPKKISHPIDLLKIEDKADKFEYDSLENFNDDIQLMLSNCLTYNSLPNSWAHKYCLSFQEFYNNNYQKFVSKINKHNEKKLLGKKRNAQSLNQIKMKPTSSYIKSNFSDIKIEKEDNSNITVLQYDNEKISKNIRNLFLSIKQNLNTTEENIENVIHILIEGFSKGNKSKNDLFDIGANFIKKYLSKNEDKTKFMKEFKSLIRNMENQQKEESTKMDQKALTIKINLEDNETNKEERLKLEKVRKIVRKFAENQKIPGVYLDKEQYSIEPELKKKIYNFVINLRTKMTSGGINMISDEVKNNENNENGKISFAKNDKSEVDENDLINL